MNKAFELALRKRIDAKFDREPRPDNPILRLINGEMQLPELRAYYKGMWQSLVVFNRVLLARLLERAPTLPIRCEVLEVVIPEFGRNLRDAHPLYFRNFLEALGVPRRELDWDFDLESGPWAAEVKLLRGFTWPQILGRIVVGESIGPVTFNAVAAACQKHHKLADYALAYFTIHAVHDKKDTEILFDIVSRSVLTPADEEQMVQVVDLSFDNGRYLDYGCRLPDTEGYRYARLFDRRTGPASGAA